MSKEIEYEVMNGGNPDGPDTPGNPSIPDIPGVEVPQIDEPKIPGQDPARA